MKRIGLAVGALCATGLLSYGGLLPAGVTVNGRVVNDVEWRHEADGEAFRYRLPQGKRVIASEDTVWTLPEDALCWYQVGIEAYEMAYLSSRVRDVPQGKVLALPITFKLADGSYRLITEANLVDYTDLAVVYEGEGRFRAVYHAEKEPFEQSGADTTPWRVTIKAKNLNELYNCDLVRRLCPEPTNEKSKAFHNPGRCIWQWLPAGDPVYAEQKDWYDKTAALGFEYYLIDDGWKNWRDGEKDQWACLKSAIDYGRSVGVKTAIWVDSKEMPTAEKRRAYLKKVVEAGAVGIKIDFMPPCDSKWCKWYEETLADTADLGLFVNFHGAVKPTGREKTWPHELAREAIRGHEWHMTRVNRVLPPEHDTILPFCRLVQGHGDYTPVVFQKDQLIHFTWPRQMAQGIVMSAPFLCLGDYPQNYLDSPMVEVIKALPATYDETIVLPGSEIGKCVALARRAGSRWFIAVENGAKERHVEFDLGFLGEGKWSVVSFCDDPSGRLDACERKARGVSSNDFVKLDLRGCGGFVAMVEKEVATFVDPFVGTAGTGHTFPAACVPFGMVQAGADTGYSGWEHCSGYIYGEKTICGFAQTHLNGTGCSDLCDVRIMPVRKEEGKSKSEKVRTGCPFDKGTEVSEPGYYAVTLTDPEARVEIAASAHSAIYRMTAKRDGELKLLVEPRSMFGKSTSITQEVGETNVNGTYRSKGWVDRMVGYAVEFDRAAKALQKDVFVFNLKEGETLMVKVGLSCKSSDAARRNLAAEIPGWDFDAVKDAARQKWNKVLGKAVIEGTDEQKKSWYTSLYHLCIQPNNIADVGEKPLYSTFSCWDTFRAAGPLYTILCPEKATEFVDSMLEQGKRTGYLPVWTLWGMDNQCMIGTHSVPMIVDWFLKRGEAVSRPLQKKEGSSSVASGQETASPLYWESAYQQIKETLTKRHEGRIKEDWDLYDRYGYYPFDLIKGESVSRTMECAYDDWCAGVMAKKLGHKEDAAFFFKRSAYWKNVFDPSIGLVRGRDAKGNWREPFNPYALGHGADLANDFTEGNAFQYTWHVMQDPQGLVAAMGGREKFVSKLDALFSAPDKVDGAGCVVDVTGLIGQYVHGNEPSHHVIYFYPQVGHPEKAAERIREVFDKFYLPKPDGLCGNDDCGQMSAWYLFSAMGFYPFNPCGGEYIIGAPQVPKVTLNLADGKTFMMTAKNLSKENKYMKSVTLNGKPITDWKIRHADIVKGGELVFEMGHKGVNE